MDTVDPVILDRWIAYEQFEQDAGLPDDSPEAALKALQKL